MSIQHQDHSRVGYSKKYADNYKKIDWGKKPKKIKDKGKKKDEKLSQK